MQKKLLIEEYVDGLDDEIFSNLKDKMIRFKDKRAKIKLKRKKIWQTIPQKKMLKNI